MEHWPYWFRERRSSAPGTLRRGKQPEVSLPKQGGIKAALGGHLGLAVIAALLAWVILWLLHVETAATSIRGFCWHAGGSMPVAFSYRLWLLAASMFFPTGLAHIHQRATLGRVWRDGHVAYGHR